jgi:hypothetical protein
MLADLARIDEVEHEVSEIVGFLRAPASSAARGSDPAGVCCSPARAVYAGAAGTLLADREPLGRPARSVHGDALR